MISNLVRNEEGTVPDMVKFLSLLYESTAFHGPLTLSKAVTLAAEKILLSRFEVLALYYKAKQRTLIHVDASETHIAL